MLLQLVVVPINASAAIVMMNANLPAADRPMLCAPSRILADFSAKECKVAE